METPLRTNNLDIAFIMPSQSQKHVTVNEAFKTLDALVQSAALDKDLTTPPPSPNVGDIYIVPNSASGHWTGRDNHIAIYTDNLWEFAKPKPGWQIFVMDENTHYLFDGTDWLQSATPLDGTYSIDISTTEKLGIGTDTPQADMHIARTGNASVLIEADTDNQTESHNPSLTLSQDGGNITSIIEIDEDNDACFTATHDQTDINFFTTWTPDTPEKRLSIRSDGHVQTFQGLGINGGMPDANNALICKASGVLLDNEGGDMGLKINKAASSDNASLALQTGFETRAEISVNNGNDFEIKTSLDGNIFNSGVKIEGATGNVSLGDVGSHEGTVTIRNVALPTLVMISETEDNITFKMADAQAQSTQKFEMVFDCGSNETHFKLNGTTSFSIKDGTSHTKFESAPELPQFNRTTLPATTVSGQVIYVPDATGGAGLAYCDGAAWKMVRDDVAP